MTKEKLIELLEEMESTALQLSETEKSLGDKEIALELLGESRGFATAIKILKSENTANFYASQFGIEI